MKIVKNVGAGTKGESHFSYGKLSPNRANEVRRAAGWLSSSSSHPVAVECLWLSIIMWPQRATYRGNPDSPFERAKNSPFELPPT